jgi:hypothetical protein
MGLTIVVHDVHANPQKAGVRDGVRKSGFSLRAPVFEIPEKCKKKREKRNFKKREIPENSGFFSPRFSGLPETLKNGVFSIFGKIVMYWSICLKMAFFGGFSVFSVFGTWLCLRVGGIDGGKPAKIANFRVFL